MWEKFEGILQVIISCVGAFEGHSGQLFGNHLRSILHLLIRSESTLTNPGLDPAGELALTISALVNGDDITLAPTLERRLKIRVNAPRGPVIAGRSGHPGAYQAFHTFLLMTRVMTRCDNLQCSSPHLPVRHICGRCVLAR